MAEENVQEEKPKRVRKPKPENGAAQTAPAAKKRGRKPKAPEGMSWDLVLTMGKRGKLSLPRNLSKDDVEAIQMQLKAIFELATVQADLESNE